MSGADDPNAPPVRSFETTYDPRSGQVTTRDVTPDAPPLDPSAFDPATLLPGLRPQGDQFECTAFVNDKQAKVLRLPPGWTPFQVVTLPPTVTGGPPLLMWCCRRRVT